MSRFAPLLLLLLVAAIHWPIDRAEFTFDDRDFVETNPSITSLAGAVAGFAQPFPPGQPERALYRPLTGLSYALDYARAGLDARTFHVTNVMLYALLVLLVQRLALAYGLSAGVALAAACLFAAHPVHCDAVDSVSGRSEVLSLLFAVAALVVFQRAAPDPNARALTPANLAAAALYAAACLAKETGSVLLAVFWVQRVAFSARPAGRAALGAWLWRPLAPHAGVLLGYALLRTSVLGRLSPEAAILADADLPTRLATMGSVFWLDFQQLLWPAVLELDFYYQALMGIPDRLTWIALVGWIGMLAVAGLALRLGLRGLYGDRPLTAREAATLCAFALFLVPLFPTSHALDIGALFAERFLFAPSLGFVLLAAETGHWLVGRLASGRSAVVAGVLLASVVTVAGAVRSQARALEWRDSVQLWRATGERMSDKRVYTNLAAAYIARGELELALAQIDAALALEPDFREGLGNRGVVLLHMGRLDAARETFERLVESDPEDALAWFNLGQIALAANEPQRAQPHFERALALEPGFAAAADGLAKARAASDAASQGRR